MDTNKSILKWLYISSDIYVCGKEEGPILLYHTITGSHMITSNFELIQIIRAIYEPTNLGVISYWFKGEESDDFNRALHNDFIKLLPFKGEKFKPLNFLPILSLQNDFSRYENPDDNPHLSRNVNRFLTELNIYLSNRKSDSSPKIEKINHIVSNQVLIPNNQEEDAFIDINELQSILLQAVHSSVKKINFIIGRTFSNRVLQKEFIKLLLDFDFEYHFHSYLNEYIFLDVDCEKLNITYDLYINKYTEKNSFEEVFTCKNCKNLYFHYLVINDKDTSYFKEYAIRNDLNINVDFIPIWTGENMDFFERCVFMTDQDIFDHPLNMQEIFRNQKINSNFFGILNIYPNKDVTGCGTSFILGNLTQSSLAELVYKELKTNTSWRITRDTTGCKNCLYRFLCPPISKYEVVSNIYNMCSIKNSSY